VTLPASGITSASATLKAAVNPHGVPTTAWFEWGTTPSCGNSTAVQSLGTVSSNVTVSAQIAGLAKGQTYYFRVHASNPVGPASGAGLSFAWAPTAPALRASTPTLRTPCVSRFAGAPGHTYQVQSSADLVHWSTAGTAPEVSDGAFEFSDTGSPNLPARFYRVVAP
jgi:hypothetical protein